MPPSDDLAARLAAQQDRDDHEMASQHSRDMGVRALAAAGGITLAIPLLLVGALALVWIMRRPANKTTSTTL